MIKKKTKILIGFVLIGVIISVGFTSLNKGLNGDRETIFETAQALKEEMEEKYNIVITNSEGYYDNTQGYGASLTTENGIRFDAWSRPNGSIDMYKEEIWRNKGLERWGYADQYIPNVDKMDLVVGYHAEESETAKTEQEKIIDLSKRIEDVKDNFAVLTLYVDLKESFHEEKREEIEEGIFHYYQQLQNDDGEGVELIVRYAENSSKQDTGSYMILRDENRGLPDIRDVEDIAESLRNFK